MGGSEVRIRRRPGRSDTGVENERDYGEEEVDVEKGRNLLTTWAVLEKVGGAGGGCATYQQQ